MIVASRAPATTVSAVISDVDGTLVTRDKAMTAETVAAVAALRNRGVAFSIISSRPPRGLAMIVNKLGISAPIAGFNGGMLTTPDLKVLAQHPLRPDVARRAVELIGAHGVAVWVFNRQDWFVRDQLGTHVDLEKHTVEFSPCVIDDFEPVLAATFKIVGVSNDPAAMAELEQDASKTLGGIATVTRSQPYYLDITDPSATKGDAFSEISRLLGIPESEIAVIGDGYNDIAMFERAGLSIAMGNASQDVQHAADLVTDSNSRDGFAKAIALFIIGGRRSNSGALSLAADSPPRAKPV
jgi:Cof subfamily protein (haloacid dehalogenase superfamily)